MCIRDRHFIADFRRKWLDEQPFYTLLLYFITAIDCRSRCLWFLLRKLLVVSLTTVRWIEIGSVHCLLLLRLIGVLALLLCFSKSHLKTAQTLMFDHYLVYLSTTTNLAGTSFQIFTHAVLVFKKKHAEINNTVTWSHVCTLHQRHAFAFYNLLPVEIALALTAIHCESV